MQKVIIMADTNSSELKNLNLNPNKDEFIIFNTIESVINYLYKTKNYDTNEIVFADYNIEVIEHFIHICNEINLDISKYHILSNDGDHYNEIDVRRRQFVDVHAFIEKNEHLLN